MMSRSMQSEWRAVFQGLIWRTEHGQHATRSLRQRRVGARGVGAGARGSRWCSRLATTVSGQTDVIALWIWLVNVRNLNPPVNFSSRLSGRELNLNRVEAFTLNLCRFVIYQTYPVAYRCFGQKPPAFGVLCFRGPAPSQAFEPLKKLCRPRSRLSRTLHILRSARCFSSVRPTG